MRRDVLDILLPLGIVAGYALALALLLANGECALMEIAWHPSPTHRPRTQPIRLIVLHATVGSYDSALGWLCNLASGVSTHYLIRKDGHTAQLVADDQVANHAGVSRWRDVWNVNGISLGIELENATTAATRTRRRSSPACARCSSSSSMPTR